MALIKCPECGHQISSSAPSCPWCGLPMGLNAVQKTPLWDIFLLPLSPEQETAFRSFIGNVKDESELEDIINGVQPISAPISSASKAMQQKAALDAISVPCEIRVHPVIEYKKPTPQDRTPRCPKCGSSSIQVVRRGFSFGKAAVGTILFGPAGAVGGALGSNNVDRVCAVCKYKW